MDSVRSGALWVAAGN